MSQKLNDLPSGSNSRRRSISLSVRFSVFSDDSFACAYCGESGVGTKLQADHIVPVANAGPDERWNLITACQDCNLGKGQQDMGPLILEILDALRCSAEWELRMSADVVRVFLRVGASVTLKAAILLGWDGFQEKWDAVRGEFYRLALATPAERQIVHRTYFPEGTGPGEAL